MKLIPMIDFVLEQRNDPMQTYKEAFWKITRYADFLKQPLKLGMFVPTDLEGNVLEEPKHKDYKNEEGGNNELYRFNLEQYKQAKQRVLFKGWFFDGDDEIISFRLNEGTVISLDLEEADYLIEDLVTTEEKSRQLTKTAINQIEL